MADVAPSREFDSYILKRLEKLFGEDELEVLVYRSEESSSTLKPDSAVCVIHLPTGTEVISHQFETQIRNKAACLVTLLLETRGSQ
jgi:protein subunit release factor A